MLLDQVYLNATNEFQNDPELRNLLMRTMDSANQSGGQPDAGQPAIFGAPNANSPDRQFNPEQLAQVAAQTSVGTNKAAPMPNAPVAPSAQDQPTSVRTTTFPGIIPGAAAAERPPAGAINPIPPGLQQVQQRPSAPRGPVPQQSQGNPIAAFLKGLGSSDAILPALGGGLAAVEEQDRANTVRNQTVRALMSRGLDADTATAAASNPEILKSVLPTLFKGNTEYKLGEDYGPDGQPRKFFYNEKNPDDIRYIGGSKGLVTPPVSRPQATANVKRVEKLKSEADGARDMLGSLNQIETLRGDTPGYIKGLPGGLGGTVAGWTDYLGITEGVKALSPEELNIQLGFTERTKGAITDREMGMFASAVPGLGMTDAAANKTMAGMRAAAQRKIEQSKFYENWLGVNKGDLTGAQEAWDAYIDANPIISRQKDGSLTVNMKNVGNWKSYVSGPGEDRSTLTGPAPGTVNYDQQGGGRGGGVPTVPNGEATPSGVNSTSIPGSGGTSGHATPPRTSTVDNPFTARPNLQRDKPVINTQEEYDALAPGSVFIDVDEVTGERREYTKPKR